MKILSTRLQNFQGARSAEYQFHGESATIYGNNATGKTTLFNAITWLLCGQSSFGDGNFLPKTKDADGNVIPKLEHMAELVLLDDSGGCRTLRKVLKEKYVRKRGAAEETRSGHKMEYYVDEIPMLEKDYKRTLEEIAGTEEQVKSLLMPLYFVETLHWEVRRRMLLDLFGNVEDSVVLDGNATLAPLRPLLRVPGNADREYTVDQYRAIVANRARDINKQKAAVPERINAVESMIPEDLRTAEEIATDVETITRQMEAKKNAIQQLQGNGPGTEAQEKLSQLKVRLQEEKAKYLETVNIANSEAAAVQQQIDTISDSLQRTLDSRSRSMTQLTHLQEQRQALLDEYNRIAAMEWTGETVCPTCQQPLPEDLIATAKEEFDRRQEHQLVAVNERGRKTCSKDKIDGVLEQIKELDVTIGQLEPQLAALQEEKRQKTKEFMPFEHTPEYAAILREINALEQDAARIAENSGETINGLQSGIKMHEQRLASLREETAAVSLAEKNLKRIDELRAQEKTLAQEYESLQYGLHLCNEFLKAKIAAVDKLISSHFPTVRFSMTKIQENGEPKEQCEVLVRCDEGLVSFDQANDAAKVNAGLEVIDVLSKHWGRSLPVIIDNAESVTELRKIGAQMIRLVVSKEDKQLRFELESDHAVQTAV